MGPASRAGSSFNRSFSGDSQDGAWTQPNVGSFLILVSSMPQPWVPWCALLLPGDFVLCAQSHGFTTQPLPLPCLHFGITLPSPHVTQHTTSGEYLEAETRLATHTPMVPAVRGSPQPIRTASGAALTYVSVTKHQRQAGSHQRGDYFGLEF